MMNNFNWDNQRGKNIKCRVKLRKSYDGREMKPCCKQLDGKNLELYVLWKMNDDDPYPNEWALGEREAGELMKAGITWVASGDVEILNAQRE
jgi:hypothetical protein